MPQLAGIVDDNQLNGSQIVEDFPGTVLAKGDFDGDSDSDLLVSYWSAKDESSRQLLLVNDNGKFSTYKKEAGISHNGSDAFALFADYNNDGYLDIYFINTEQDRLYHNNSDGTFSDVSSASGLDIISNGNAAIFTDLDLEGDLDLFIASSSQNRLFRNNLDGTFTEITTQSGFPAKGDTADSRDACFADYDNDGDIDLFVANYNSRDQLFDNLRQSNFHDKGETAFGINRASQALASADYNNDGFPDIFVTDWKGQNHALYQNTGKGIFKKDNNSEKAFASLNGLAGYSAEFFDLDNDGHLDLLFGGTAGDQSAATHGLKLFYNDGRGRFLDATALLPDVTTGVLQSVIDDFDGDGDLDIIYVGADKSIRYLKNKGGNSHNNHSVRLRGLRTASGKNNYFGIGARIEVKSGSLYQVKVMDQAVAHFGIGDARAADIIRIVWPNGTAQNWFEPQKNQTIVESQVLKGSCPYLYAWNGVSFEFTTDVLWPSAIGMPLGIMGKEKVYAFANSTDEYLKISGDNIKSRNRKYIFRFATELWETPYLDKVKLLVVDHPQNSDIYVNERFTPPPFDPFRVYSVRDKKIPLSASDENGSNILNEIAQQDGIYLANLKPAGFQGIMAMHDIILDLGDLSGTDSIFLFMNGWLFPTDASINVNISQTAAVQTISPYLQVKGRNGKWKTVIENMGFPKGKNKTMIFDLTDAFIADDYKIRIQTNMQIYWDHIFYATDVNQTKIKISQLAPIQADLQFRGFSEVSRETPYSPHIPDYNKVSTEARWRDLTGFYTRYGDVLPLLMESDNKYAIMNAGDAITLKFDMDNVADLAAGWKRDFIFYNDGWLKDGDLNTAHGQTVEPLPFHSMTRYPYGDEQGYPATNEYQDYLREYNTREVSAEPFKKWLRNKTLSKK